MLSCRHTRGCSRVGQCDNPPPPPSFHTKSKHTHIALRKQCIPRTLVQTWQPCGCGRLLHPPSSSLRPIWTRTHAHTHRTRGPEASTAAGAHHASVCSLHAQISDPQYHAKGRGGRAHIQMLHGHLLPAAGSTKIPRTPPPPPPTHTGVHSASNKQSHAPPLSITHFFLASSFRWALRLLRSTDSSSADLGAELPPSPFPPSGLLSSCRKSALDF
jgi:hypothetical protein